MTDIGTNTAGIATTSRTSGPTPHGYRNEHGRRRDQRHGHRNNTAGIATNVTDIGTNTAGTMSHCDQHRRRRDKRHRHLRDCDQRHRHVDAANVADQHAGIGHVTGIGTNTAGIATNNIGTNTAGVATNVTDIATNVTDIATTRRTLASFNCAVRIISTPTCCEGPLQRPARAV